MIAHVFVDAENIPPTVTFQVVEYFSKEHTITRVDIVAKEDTLPSKYKNLDKKIYRVQNCFYGKNAADTWLCMEVVRAIIDEPDLELIIIVSSDKDFLPVIKFAVDFDKKIFIVSDGAGHKSLSEQLQKLKIPLSAVVLKDFHSNFGGVSEKLEKFLSCLSFKIRKYLLDRETRIKFILVKKGEQLFEVPFVPGMTTYIFRQILRELNILGGKYPIREFVSQNFLKLSKNKIYFHTENELYLPSPAEQIENYFAEHTAETIKIFIKHNGRLSEIPFVDGMPLDIFSKLLYEKKIINKTSAAAQTAEKNLLKIVDEKVFLCSEEEQLVAYGKTIKNLDEYFSFYAAELRKVFIKHGQKTFELPFVNGMSLELFGKLLRENNIVGKSASVTSIAKKNFLEIRDGKVFLCDEDRLAELYAESTNNLKKYFEYHAAAVKNVFIKHNGNIFEIPFVDGMPLTLFNKLLLERKIIGRNSSAIKVAAQSLLDIREERVYLIDENELEAAQDDLETNVDEYFNEHVWQIKSISIQHDGEIFDVPFVEGMPLKIFGKLLRERKIINRKISLEEFIADNKLILRDKKIFFWS